MIFVVKPSSIVENSVKISKVGLRRDWRNHPSGQVSQIELHSPKIVVGASSTVQAC